MSLQDTQETTRVTRSLKTVQPTANDNKNLVGRPSKRFKHQISQENNEPVEVKKKNVANKETQANLDGNIIEDDLINTDEPSGKYWQILAEKRQIALQEFLDKNAKLLEIIEHYKKENAVLKQMVSEANSFVEIVKEELASNNSNDDTGIDVNDVSSADDTAEETNEVSSNDDN